jgi:glycosyltransferase involved in cell wall biosynthesis
MVTDFYPPIIGGLERQVQILSRELARRGHHVAVATLWHGDAPAFDIDEGVRVHRLSGWNRLLAPFYASASRPFHPTMPDPGVMAGLRHVLEQEKPDIINAHSWMVYSVLPLKAWSKAKLIMTLHDYGLTCVTKTYMHNGSTVCDGSRYAKCLQCAIAHYGTPKGMALTSGLYVSKYLHKSVDHYIANSQAVQMASAPSTGWPRPVSVVPVSVPDSALDDAVAVERPAFLPRANNYILFVGALSEHKGINVLLKAYTELSDKAGLVVIGARYGEAAMELPDGVTIQCNVPHPQVMAAWRHCAVGVVPSVWPEPFGQVALEAMVTGRPVVASSTGGLADVVVNGETGILVPPGDVAALREALRTLLDDPERRARMGEAGRRRARHFTVSTVTDRFEQICTETLTDLPATKRSEVLPT